jgi:hypothetical protein
MYCEEDCYITIATNNYDKNETCCICLERCEELQLNCCNIVMHNACFCILIANGHLDCPLCRTPIEKYCYLTNEILDNAELYLDRKKTEYPSNNEFKKYLAQIQVLKANEGSLLRYNKFVFPLLLLGLYTLLFILVFLETRNITK